MDRVGNVPTSVVCRPKGDYVKRDMRRWAKRYGIPFQPNPAMREADMTRLPRAAIPADRIGAADNAVAALFAALWREPAPRSAEHTSELQSLIRTSYAVFCLKKNKLPNTNT